MSTHLAADHPARILRAAPQRVAAGRAALALAWAAALLVALGDDVPLTRSELPLAAALLLAGYPLIDVVASLLTATATDRLLRVGAAISAVAVVAVGIAALGADAGATLVAFGAWASVSGALQLGVALCRRGEGGRLPMVISGGLSTLAGLSFIAAAGQADAHLGTLAGYMALGAVLYLVWARRTRGQVPAAA